MKALSVAHRKKLHDRAGGECAFPACFVREPLQEAHIFARSDGGPRANPTMLQAMREVYENFIIVCANHHWVIDRDENRYTVAAVREMKTTHERDIAARGGEKLVGIKSTADRGGTSIAAGRDVNNYYTAPVTQQDRPPVSDEPSFDLTFKPSPDNFVHLLLANKSTPAEFHLDVIDVAARKTQTTPYSVKWRGFEGEDRRVVREALIDLVQVSAPFRRREYEHVVVIDPYDEGGSRIWRHAQFRLFSFSQQKGWVVRGTDQEETNGDELRFFREELILVVRATRLDTGEEITRRVTIGFEAPTQDERTREWIDTATSVRVEALTPVA